MAEFPGQFKDEEVLFTFRRHPIVMRKGFVIVLIVALIGSLVGLYRSRAATTNGEFFGSFFGSVGLGLIIGLILFSYYWIGWYYSMCIVTNQRFVQISQTGIFKSRSVNDISLARILSVNYEVKGMMANLLGFGTIIIQTLVGDFVIEKAPKPAATQAGIVTSIKESGITLDETAAEIS